MKFRGQNGSQSAGLVDGVDNSGPWSSAFPVVGVQPPDAANLSLKIFRRGSFADQIKADELDTVIAPRSSPAVRQHCRTCCTPFPSGSASTPPSFKGADTTGSGEQRRAIQFTLPFESRSANLQPASRFLHWRRRPDSRRIGRFGLHHRSEFQLTVGLQLDPGINTQDRFFIVQDAAPEVTLDVTADLKNPAVTGTVGFFGYSSGSRPGDSQ